MDFVVASIGVLQSLITSSVFQVIIKCLIGGLRPHFLAACKPVIPYNPLHTFNFTFFRSPDSAVSRFTAPLPRLIPTVLVYLKAALDLKRVVRLLC